MINLITAKNSKTQRTWVESIIMTKACAWHKMAASTWQFCRASCSIHFAFIHSYFPKYAAGNLCHNTLAFLTKIVFTSLSIHSEEWQGFQKKRQLRDFLWTLNPNTVKSQVSTWVYDMAIKFIPKGHSKSNKISPSKKIWKKPACASKQDRLVLVTQ